jgi:hypothetical protein
MDVVLIVVKKYTEFGNDPQKIYSDGTEDKLSYYYRQLVSGKKGGPAEIRPGRSA